MNTAQFISIFNSGGNPLGPFQERVTADGGTVEGLDNMLAKYDASASWQLIATAVKAGTAYAQVPNTSLGDLTVTRASSGTYTDSSGVIQTAANNVLRTDFRNADGTLSTTGRYLFEPQRTNLVFPSATATTQTRTVTAAAHTLTIYGTGSVTLSGVATGTLNGTGANNRVALTFTPTAGSLTLTVSGTVTNWQLEVGAFSSTLIPTTTAAVTRIADSASKTGVSSLIGQTEGTLFVDIIPGDVTTTNAIGINNGTTSNRIVIFTGSGLIFAQVRVGGVSQFNVSTSASVGQRYKAALAYKGSDFAFYLNGAQIAVTTTGTVPACSVISFDTGAGVSPFVGRNNQAALFSTRLTNAQLAQLTTL